MFQEVASAPDLKKGEGKVVEAGGKQIALFNVNGEFHAIDNECVHKGGPLGDGLLDGDVVTCPWHGWKYNVKTGVSPVNPDVKVSCFPVKVEDGKISVDV